MAQGLLAYRRIGPGQPVALEPDGSGGAFVLGEREGGLVLGRYGADPEQPPLWEITHPGEPRDLAVNAVYGRAYVLTAEGVEVFALW